ncbi:MAG: hypothetical protein Q7T41_01410 [Candidatus Saccharibacteria bacterium]|nr:hypothetical protein [Candidatus Saccharibacteria bacterium]
MKKSRSTFYCFSPPVMIATFFIETFLIIYTLFYRKLNKSVKIGIILISCLAIFQLAEYGVCETLGAQASFGSRLGFVAITLLPPLGIHLVSSVAKKQNRLLIAVSYLAAFSWILYFIFGDIMTGSVCEANYVIFNIAEPYEGLYYIYYDSLVLLAVGLATVYAQKKNKLPKKHRKALYTLVIGYLAFIIPSMVFTLIDDYKGADSPLPSVMCGFAVILALMIAFGTLPLVTERKKR